jgi:hypothetical protein
MDVSKLAEADDYVHCEPCDRYIKRKSLARHNNSKKHKGFQQNLDLNDINEDIGSAFLGSTLQ